MASVIIPTIIVKTTQIVADKAVDKVPVLIGLKNKINKFAESKPLLNKIFKEPRKQGPLKSDNFIKRSVRATANGFQKVIDTITVVPLLFKKFGKPKTVPPSPLRKLGLAVVGSAALAASIKPVDKLVQKIVDDIIHPFIYKETDITNNATLNEKRS